MYIEYLRVLYYYDCWTIKRSYKSIYFVRGIHPINPVLVHARASFILITAYIGAISITIIIPAQTVIISGSYLPLRKHPMNSHPTTGKSELPTNWILFLGFNIFLGIDFPYIKVLWLHRNKSMSCDSEKTLTSERKEQEGGWVNTLFIIRYSIPRFIGRMREYPLHRISAFFVSLAYAHDRLSSPLSFSLLACTQSTRKYNGNQPEWSRSELMNEIKSVPFVDSSLTGGGKSRENVRSTGGEGGPLQIPIDMMHTHPDPDCVITVECH